MWQSTNLKKIKARPDVYATLMPTGNIQIYDGVVASKTIWTSPPAAKGVKGPF